MRPLRQYRLSWPARCIRNSRSQRAHQPPHRHGHRRREHGTRSARRRHDHDDRGWRRQMPVRPHLGRRDIAGHREPLKMPTFTYKAMDAHDRFITGEIEAADPREVSRELEKLGYVVLDTETGMRGATSKSTLLRLFHRPAGRREM